MSPSSVAIIAFCAPRSGHINWIYFCVYERFIVWEGVAVYFEQFKSLAFQFPFDARSMAHSSSWLEVIHCVKMTKLLRATISEHLWINVCRVRCRDDFFSSLCFSFFDNFSQVADTNTYQWSARMSLQEWKRMKWKCADWRHRSHRRLRNFNDETKQSAEYLL